MVEPGSDWSEHAVETAVGRLLRAGVVLAAAVVLCGAVIYLWHHGGARPNYHVFRGESRSLRQLGSIVQDAAALKGRELIQLGLLLLIATPVMRVAFCAYAFMRQRDRLYVLVSMVVLAVLLFSLFVMR